MRSSLRGMPGGGSFLALLAVGAAGQGQSNGWMVIADDGRVSAIEFVSMEPGWHVTARTDGLIYQPTLILDGTFRAEYDVHIFPGDPAGAGVFFGGQNLAPGSYDFFEVLLDNEGRYRLRHIAGREYHEIIPWTRNEAIRTPTDGASAQNIMVLDASPERFAMSVNGVEVVSFAPPDYARFDGAAGLRVQSGVGVHVAGLEFVDTDPEPDAAP